MDARPVARRLADALSGESEPDTRSAEPPDVAAAHAGMQVDGSSRSASDNEQGRAAMDVVSQLRDRVLLKRPAGKAASKAAAKPKAAPKSKCWRSLTKQVGNAESYDCSEAHTTNLSALVRQPRRKARVRVSAKQDSACSGINTIWPPAERCDVKGLRFF